MIDITYALFTAAGYLWVIFFLLMVVAASNDNS